MMFEVELEVGRDDGMGNFQVETNTRTVREPQDSRIPLVE